MATTIWPATSATPASWRYRTEPEDLGEPETGKPPAEAGGEDEEIFVFSDDDDDLPAARVAIAGATADPVKDYLKQIGKVPLLNAEQEVDLAKRIEAGLFAEDKLAEASENLPRDLRTGPGVGRRGRPPGQGPPA